MPPLFLEGNVKDVEDVGEVKGAELLPSTVVFARQIVGFVESDDAMVEVIHAVPIGRNDGAVFGSRTIGHFVGRTLGHFNAWRCSKMRVSEDWGKGWRL